MASVFILPGMIMLVPLVPEILCNPLPILSQSSELHEETTTGPNQVLEANKSHILIFTNIQGEEFRCQGNWVFGYHLVLYPPCSQQIKKSELAMIKLELDRQTQIVIHFMS